MSVDVGSAVGYLDLDISGFLRNWRTAQDEADSASKNIVTKIGKNLSGVGSSLSSAGSALTKHITTPVSLAGGAVIKLSSDFEYEMSKVKAISGAVGGQFSDLRDLAIDLGASTAFSASEVAEGMTEMAKAGWETEDILAGMSGVLDAAAASGERLSSVSTIMADALTGFGLEAKESTRVANLLTQAANSGTIDISDLGESFKYISPVAKAMDFEIEEVTAALSAMSMAGIKGSQAGTALRTMLTNLVKPSDDMAVAMKELGIEVANQDGSMKSLDTILFDLRKSFSGLTEEQKSYYAATLAGKTGMSGMLSLMTMTQEEYDEITKSMYECGDVAKKTAETMQDNLKSQVEQLTGSLESLAIQIGDIVLPYVKKFVDKIQELVLWFSNLSTEQKEQVIKWALLAASIGPVLSVVGKLISGFGGLFTTFGKIPGLVKNVAKSFKTAVNSVKNVGEAFKLAKAGWTGLAGSTSKLGTALAGVTGPMIALVAVVAALVAAFVSLWKNNEEFRNRIIQIWNEIVQAFSGFFSQISERLQSLWQDFSVIVELLKILWQGLCDLLAPLFIGAFQFIADTLKGLLDIIIGIIDFFIAGFKGDWEGAWDAVKNIFLAAWEWIVDTFKNIIEILIGLLDAVCGWFGTTWEDTWEAIKKFFVDTWNVIVDFFTITWDAIKLVVSDTVDKIWTDITTTFESVKSSISSIWEGIKTTISDAIDGAQKAVSDTIDTVQKNISDGFNAAWQTVTGIFDNIKKSISDAMESAQTTVSNVIEKIKGFFDFEWSLPKLKMPKITITGKFSLNPLQVPKFSISWFKSAMENGMILSSPTIFGFDSSTGKFLAGGEAGSETVVGTKSLMKMIQNAVNNAMRQNYSLIAQSINSIYQNFTTSSRELVGLLSKILKATQLYTVAVENIGFSGRPGTNGGSIDYTLLAATLADVLRDSPVEPKIEVYMENGDVYLDKERVGRSVAPVISRIVVQK